MPARARISPEAAIKGASILTQASGASALRRRCEASSYRLPAVSPDGWQRQLRDGPPAPRSARRAAEAAPASGGAAAAPPRPAVPTPEPVPVPAPEAGSSGSFREPGASRQADPGPAPPLSPVSSGAGRGPYWYLQPGAATSPHAASPLPVQRNVSHGAAARVSLGTIAADDFDSEFESQADVAGAPVPETAEFVGGGLPVPTPRKALGDPATPEPAGDRWSSERSSGGRGEDASLGGRGQGDATTPVLPTIAIPLAGLAPAPVDARSSCGTEAVDHASVSSVDADGSTAVDHAFEAGGGSAVEFALEAGSTAGGSALNAAMTALFELLPFYRLQDGNVDALVRATVGGMTPQDCAAVDSTGSTALIVCAQFCHDDLADMLLARGADVDATSTAGVTALSYACGSEAFSEPMIRVLLSREANVNIPEQHYGCLALHYLAGTGNARLCQLLLEHGADASTRDWYDWAPADYAAEAGFADVAAVLRAAAEACLASRQAAPMRPEPVSPVATLRRGALEEGARAAFKEERDRLVSAHEAEMRAAAAKLEKVRAAAAALAFETKALTRSLDDEKAAGAAMRLREAAARDGARDGELAAADSRARASEGDVRLRALEQEVLLQTRQADELRATLERTRSHAADGSRLQKDAHDHAASLEKRVADLEAAVSKGASEKDALGRENDRLVSSAQAASSDAAAAAAGLRGQLEAAAARATQLKQASEAGLKEAHDAREAASVAARRAALEAEEKLRRAETLCADERAARERSAQQLSDAETAVREAGAVAARNEQLDVDLSREVRRRKALHNQVEDLKGRIRVYCRIRPLSDSETARDCKVCCEGAGDRGVVVKREDRKPPQDRQNFDFDRAFVGADASNSQEKVFADVKSLVLSCVDGYNVCVLAYGQTGSGKTYTMGGAKSVRESVDTKTWAVDASAGVIPRAAVEIFRKFDEKAAQCTTELDLCLFELYRDALVDLLAPLPRGGAKAAPLTVKLAPTSGTGLVAVGGAVVLRVDSLEALVAALESGLAKRQTTATAMNAESSRSHLVISLVLRTTNRRTGHVVNGKLTLVDLAGSERVEKSGVVGDQLKEATSINKSLSAVGDVIAALSDGQQHVPYRNHTLTMLLSDSLGGSAKTLMFVNCSPADYNAAETASSLGFATRCKTVKIAEPGALQSQLAQLQSEVARMKASGQQGAKKANQAPGMPGKHPGPPGKHAPGKR